MFHCVTRGASRFCRFFAAGSLLVGLSAAPAMAQDDADEPLEEITVTGTLIPRPDVEGLSPVAVMGVTSATILPLSFTFAGNPR